MRSPMRSPRVSSRAARARTGVALRRPGRSSKVGGDDRGAIVVVAGVQDQAYRVPNPFGRLDGAQFVEHQHFGFEHRAQDLQFGGLHRIVVGVLDLLQQFAIVVEEAGMPLPRISSLMMPTARWVLPTPMLPISSSPVLSTGYSSTNLPAARRDEASAGGDRQNRIRELAVLVAFGDSGCGSRAWARACRRQSQRVTRRSEPTETDFQPVPSHREQTSDRNLHDLGSII